MAPVSLKIKLQAQEGPTQQGGKMKALLLSLMFAVALAPLASAQTTKKSSAAKTMKATGTIVSATDTSLVISDASKKESTFVLNADTKKDGAMTAGAKASVTYKMDGKDMVATSVKATGGATAASTSAAPKSSSKKKAGS